MQHNFQRLKDNNFFYNARLKLRAAQLRKRYTKPERQMWQDQLIARKLGGYRFMRQVPVLYFVVDFMCKELGLIIEVDRPIHRYTKRRDTKWQYRLEGCGFCVLRFSNKEVMQQPERVRQVLEDWVATFEGKYNIIK